MFTKETAKTLLDAAEVFFLDEDEFSELTQTLNMNDTWGWALADGEYVPDECLSEVAELFWRYGNAGLLYWVSERHNKRKSEFHNNNRAIEFVRKEEELRRKYPDSSELAYKKTKYTIGIE